MPSLPDFIMSRPYSEIPATPRVISPSPTPSERLQDGGYFGPMTRSAKKKLAAQAAIDEGIDEDEDSGVELERARARSRSPINPRKISTSTVKTTKKHSKTAKTADAVDAHDTNGKASNGHLSPATASSGWSWQDFSRSPSPLGLIPIHRQWRSFVHRHEVPRKVLHVSIGFFTIWLYVSGVQTSDITPYLMSALIPIATFDYLRHNYPGLNRLYVRLLGALMRETEYDGWNGVIWYLLGAWIVLGFFPKDIGVMGVLLLSWCDTAASTVGRAYGRYTPRLRRGKSLAGSLAAFAVGVITAASFWGWLAPRTGPFSDDVDWPFMFSGDLKLPAGIRDLIGLSEAHSTISGGLALGVMSLWTGFTAAASEVVDIFGWDDNLTIPVLSGMGMWGFLKVFG
jgi:diacylglycerol kinase (CTP)